MFKLIFYLDFLITKNILVADKIVEANWIKCSIFFFVIFKKLIFIFYYMCND